MSDQLSGRTLGRYQVLERLGRGGMAEVYRAYQPSLDRFVAIKVIYPHLATDPGLRERFGREARAVAALHHPNIVQVHDFDMQGDTAFMAMEFINGPTLKAAIASLGQRGRLLPLPVVGQIVGQLAEALAYAHEQQVVHRDVKPANVLLRRRGRAEPGREPGEQPGSRTLPPLSDASLEELLLRLGPSSVVLTDFGVARVISDSLEQTAAGTILGSPAYMSPEQGRGERAGPASDIYSLGVVLYELVTGRVPFDADTPFAIVIKHTQAPLPPPRSFRPDLPESLERALLKALAKDPADRFNDAAAFGAAVREACGAPTAAPLRLAEALAPRSEADPAAPQAGATRVIDELHATRLGTPAPPGAQTKAEPATVASTAAQAPAAPKGRGRWLLGCLLGLLALGALVAVAFFAGGALVFRGLGQAGALVVPTQYSAEATAAAAQGTSIPLNGELRATAPPPAAVAEALAAARDACAAPGCPGGSASAAIAVLDAALATAPDSAPLYAARAQTYVWWDPYSYAEQARADADAALARDPASAAAHLARGSLGAILAEDDAQRDAALDDLAQAIALDPTLAEAFVVRARLLSDAPEFYDERSPSREQVIADTTAALALDPELLPALLMRAEAHNTASMPDEAHADYTSALAIDPASLQALLRRGDIARYSREDSTAALADYDAAIAAHPDDADGRRARATLLSEQGEFAAAMPDADAMVALEPFNPDVYSFRGQLGLAAGELDAALEDFEQVLLLAGPSDLAARYGRGKVRLEQGDPASALADLEAAAAEVDELAIDWYTFFGGHYQIFVDLARAYSAVERPGDAEGALDEAIERDDSWHLPYLLRGRLRAAAGDNVGARSDLRSALELVGTAPDRGAIEDELRTLP